MAEQEKQKTGAKSRYKEKYCDMVIEHLNGGQSLASFARSIGTHREVIWAWRKKYPEFNHACLTGLEAAQVWWENLASIVATGKNMDIETDEKSPNYGKPKLPYTNPGMIMFLMKQRFADYRRDKQSFDDEREATGSARPTLEPQELDNEIERRLEKRRLLRENGATGTVKRGRPFGSKTKLD